MIPAALTESKSVQTEPSEPQGKFQKFCNWVGDHKKEIAVAFLVIGVALATFGIGAILALIPLSHFSTVHIAALIVELFSFKGTLVSGLSPKGVLFFSGLGALIVGGTFAGFGAGVLAGVPSETKK